MTVDRRRVRMIAGRLVKRFGPLEAPRRTDPLEELILTVLSQHTSDANAERAFSALRVTYPTWQAVARARTSELAATIRPGGLANTKASRIRAILREILEREGRYDLSFLRRCSDVEAREYLSSLPGVGPKTTAVVLVFSLGRATIPVDTHVHRVTKRLGLVPQRSSAERAHEILEELVPASLKLELHVGLIRLGREICKAGRPRCEACPLADLCPAAPGVLGFTRGRAPR
jgi:endonuclease-3